MKKRGSSRRRRRRSTEVEEGEEEEEDKGPSALSAVDAVSQTKRPPARKRQRRQQDEDEDDDDDDDAGDGDYQQPTDNEDSGSPLKTRPAAHGIKMLASAAPSSSSSSAGEVAASGKDSSGGGGGDDDDDDAAAAHRRLPQHVRRITPTFVGMLSGLLAAEDNLEPGCRVLEEQFANGRAPGEGVFDAVWSVLSQGTTVIDRAERLISDLEQALKLFPVGKVERSCPLVHEPLVENDVKRYRHLFAILRDALLFKNGCWKAVVLCHLRFMGVMHAAMLQDLKYFKSQKRTQDSAFYRLITLAQGTELELRHHIFEAAFEFLDMEEEVIESLLIMQQLKSVARSILHLLSELYFGARESWRREWDFIGDLSARVRGFAHAKKIEFMESLQDRRLRRELAARVLEDTFSSASVDKDDLKFREEPLSEDKIVRYYFHLEPKRKDVLASRGRRKPQNEIEGRELKELFVTLLYQLIKDYFTKKRLAAALTTTERRDDEDKIKEEEDEAGPPLAGALARLIERTRKDNANLMTLSPVFRTYLNLLDLFRSSLRGSLI